MREKRALIVDDSKSARLFLSRILEKYEIQVDMAESAEQAIEYLTQQQQPDVIFMDHLMPGMDGFQAVQVIKNNPRTATIPILMYTSQEGELYLGQARALGAVGVLPKQIKPADVSKVLYQLHLLHDRRSSEQTSFRQVPSHHDDTSELEAPAFPGITTLTGSGREPSSGPTIREQFAEIRRSIIVSLDTQYERIIADTRAMLLEAIPPPPVEPPPAEPPPKPWSWIIASLALAMAIATTALWWREVVAGRALTRQVAALQSSTNELLELTREQAEAAALVVAAASSAQAADVEDATPSRNAASRGSSSAGGRASSADAGRNRAAGQPAGAKPIIEPVPYGAEPLSGQRIEVIRGVLRQLAGTNYRGTVDIRTFPGRFCVVGNATEGFSLAPEETSYSRCEAVANPRDEGRDTPNVPLDLANLIGATRTATQGAINVQVSSGDPAATLVAYPNTSESPTAGEWNRAAAANNRIEIRLR